MNEPAPTTLTIRVFLALLLGGLLLMSYLVLRPFLVPLAWAGILAYTTWPLYHRLLNRMGSRPNLSALTMTLLLLAAFVLPLLWMMTLLRDELATAYTMISSYLAAGPHRLPEAISKVPWLGEWLQRILDQLAADPATLQSQLKQWAGTRSDEMIEVAGGVGRNAAKLGFALFAVFFLYRDGEQVLDQVRRVLRRFLGSRVDGYLRAAGATTRAVVYGLVLTALAQGALAGVGYWAAGVEAPILLGAFTALIALIPFGTPVVWGSIGIWLLLNGHVAQGIGLLLWGALVVSWVDNLIRPLVISSATQIPFLLVMFGVLGGLAAFGLVGLFLGPVILAILMAVWREWLEDTQAPEPPDELTSSDQ